MPAHRLHHSRDIRAVFTARSAARGRTVSVHARRSDTGEETRVAVIASKEVGNAVRRNRAKRRIRAAVAVMPLPSGFDLVVRAQPQAIDADFDVLQAELRHVIKRATLRAANTVTPGGQI